jgi:hypothetical protein
VKANLHGIERRLTPRFVKMIVAGEVLLLACLIILAKVGLISISRREQLVWLLALIFGLIARGIAFRLYVSVADEYRNARLSRLVWLAFALNAAVLFVRGLVCNDIVAGLTDNYYQSPLRGLLNHLFSVPASILLLSGLVGMLQSYRHAGLGTKLSRRDYVLIGISLALFGWLLIFHENLEEGHSPWIINRILQPVNLALLAAASVVSIVLHRYTAVMQGGKMAVVLRFLVLYGALTGFLVLMIQLVLPIIQRTVSFDATPLTYLWALIPWLSTLAAATRAEMTSEVMARVAKLKQTAVQHEVVVSALRVEGSS